MAGLRTGATSTVMIGDSTWDAQAAGKLGVPTFAVRTGGFLRHRTVRRRCAVYDSLSGLQADLAGSSPATDQGSANPFAQAPGHSRKRTCACAAAVA